MKDGAYGEMLARTDEQPASAVVDDRLVEYRRLEELEVVQGIVDGFYPVIAFLHDSKYSKNILSNNKPIVIHYIGNILFAQREPLSFYMFMFI